MSNSETLESLERILKECKGATLKSNPKDFFAFMGASNHVNTSLRLIKDLIKTEELVFTDYEVNTVIKKLESLVKYIEKE